jgi:hypothetical protein
MLSLRDPQQRITPLPAHWSGRNTKACKAGGIKAIFEKTVFQ